MKICCSNPKNISPILKKGNCLLQRSRFQPDYGILNIQYIWDASMLSFGNMKTPTQKIAIQNIPAGQSPPRKFQPKKIPTQNNSHPENFLPQQLPQNSRPEYFHTR